ncbi:MAG: hypothetical protein AAFO07_24140 [Bacteroidota bacterium]
MAHILKNDQVEILIDFPSENYNLSRFDWTGKIKAVDFKGKKVAGVEIENAPENSLCGKGYCNEFGMDTALGYDDAEIGEWFHKIGIGLLKKDDEQYNFQKAYEVNPADFEVTIEADRMIVRCQSQQYNGYCYVLEKEIRLKDNGFELHYCLENTGDKAIVTDEYNHNFLSIDQALMCKDYVLRFPFQVKPDHFGSIVNPGEYVEVSQHEFTFNGTPNEQFFFSNLSGGDEVNAQWSLENIKSEIRISETGDFQTSKINLWGWKHVISPELFFAINIQPGEHAKWSRKYEIYSL